MKKDVHPQYRPVCFVDVSTGKEFLTHSVMKSKETKLIDGVEHQLVICDITMDSHPAYTGEKRFIDTAGRVEKFQKKFRQRAVKTP